MGGYVFKEINLNLIMLPVHVELGISFAFRPKGSCFYPVHQF